MRTYSARRPMSLSLSLSLFVYLLLGTTCAVNADCITDPSDPACADFKLPDSEVSASIEALCQSMPHMPGCSIQKLCTSHRSVSRSAYCKPFSVLKDICTEMNMKPCANYSSMCKHGSVVKQCQMEYLHLPTGQELEDFITSMCRSMPMPDCSRCGLSESAQVRVLDCDMLQVYSDLCLSMPGMSKCYEWKVLCGVLGSSWPICPGSQTNVVQMRQYFHTDIVNYVLIEDWVPRTTAEYVATWFAVFFIGIAYEILKFILMVFDTRFKSKPDGKKGMSFYWVPMRIFVDLPRSLLVCMEIGLGLLAMLIAMTFNVGLFLSVCASACIGRFVFSRVKAIYHHPKPVTLLYTDECS